MNTNQRIFKRWTARLLCVCLLLGLLPAPAARAAEEPIGTTFWYALTLSGAALDKVYRLSASVYALNEDTMIVVAPGDDQATAGRLAVTPLTEDTGLADARPGDTVTITGRLSGSPVDSMTCTAAVERSPNPLWGLADGDTFHWTGGGHLVVPWSVCTLTITGDGTPMVGNIVADEFHPDLSLTIEKLSITTDSNAIQLPSDSNSSLTVRGACEITSSIDSDIVNGILLVKSVVYCNALRVEEGATLNIVGTGTSAGIYARSLELARGSRMTAVTGLVGLTENRSISIVNDGILELQGNLCALGIFSGNESISFQGTGVSRLLSMGGTNGYAPEGCGISAPSTAVKLLGGQVEIAGRNTGIYTAGTGTVEIGPGVTGAIMGGTDAAPNDQSAGGMRRFDTLLPGPADGGLDLSAVDTPTAWLYPKGTAQWTPATGEDPARFVLSALEQGALSGGLNLTKGVTFPANTAVDVVMSANTGIENSGPAISAPGGTLTFSTPCMDENFRPSIHGKAAGRMGIFAPGGTVAFVGGNFQLYGKGGVSDAPITVRDNLGRVTMLTEAPAVPAAPAGITVDPTEAVSRAACHAELTTLDRSTGALVHLAGSPSNKAISYTGRDMDLTAAIVAGAVSEPATYQVTYKANYAGGPADVTDAGHLFGETVTVKSSNLFAAPAYKTFAGWAESASGPVKYQPGDTFSMPDNDVTLYAVWSNISGGGGSGGGGGPSTYAVIYKANYPGGPADVRDGGHSAGSKVTAKAGDTFAAPEGKTFAGWAVSAAGEVKYRAGQTFSMPSQALTLYAVWRDEKSPDPEQKAPSLNKTDHMAYLTGYPDGRVGPADLITREQTAAIFFRLLDADSSARYHSAHSPFPDVADSRWSAEAVATMANAGILKGLPDGTFGPERPITRAEFAAIAARFGAETYTGPDLFPDIAGHWAAEEINRAAQKGWVKGGADGLFRPNDPITRAEAAALVNRVLERAPETAADLLSGMKTFPDNANPGAWYYLDLQEAANGHDYNRKPDGVHETWTALAN